MNVKYRSNTGTTCVMINSNIHRSYDIYVKNVFELIST